MEDTVDGARRLALLLTFERWTSLLCFGQGRGVLIEPLSRLKGNRARKRPMVASLSQVSGAASGSGCLSAFTLSGGGRGIRITDAAGVEASGELIIAIRATLLLFVAGSSSRLGRMAASSPWGMLSAKNRARAKLVPFPEISGAFFASVRGANQRHSLRGGGTPAPRREILSVENLL